MNQSFEVHAVSSPGEKLDIVRDREGVVTHPITLTRSITPFRDLIAIWNLYRLLRKIKPTIVHTHTPKAGMVGMIAAKLARVPIRLHTVAGLPVETKRGIIRTILLKIERLAYACAHRVYPNSQGMLDFIEQAKLCNNAKLKIIGQGSTNGINLEHFRRTSEVLARASGIRNELNVADNDVLFCFVGRLVRDKGIEELMWSYKKIAAKHANAKLLLLGKFEEHLDPLSESAKNTLENHPGIHFVGYQDDVRPYMVASDVFVFPSYREGLPNVLLQAGAMGVATVATRINGNTDIIENDVNGILVSPQNKEDLFEGMSSLFNNPDLRQRIGNCSRAHIEERYGQATLWKEIQQEYFQLIESRDSIN